jgi:L-fuconolactonase
MSRIDTHLHLFDTSRFPYDWIEGPYAPLARHTGLGVPVPDAAAVGVTGFVVVEATGTPAETAWLLETARESAAIRGVVGWIDLAADDVGEEIDRLGSTGAGTLVGFRRSAQSEPDAGWLAQLEVSRGLKAVGSADLVFDLLVRPPQLAVAVEVVARLSDVRFVLDHLGKPTLETGDIAEWAKTLRLLATFPNVAAKISGLVTEASWSSWTIDDLRPAFDIAVDAFGPERLMFGSDWPVASLAADYGTVVETAATLIDGFSAAEKHAFWSGTAEQWYRLP